MSRADARKPATSARDEIRGQRSDWDERPGGAAWPAHTRGLVAAAAAACPDQFRPRFEESVRADLPRVARGGWPPGRHLYDRVPELGFVRAVLEEVDLGDLTRDDQRRGVRCGDDLRPAEPALIEVIVYALDGGPGRCRDPAAKWLPRCLSRPEERIARRTAVSAGPPGRASHHTAVAPAGLAPDAPGLAATPTRREERLSGFGRRGPPRRLT